MDPCLPRTSQQLGLVCTEGSESVWCAGPLASCYLLARLLADSGSCREASDSLEVCSSQTWLPAAARGSHRCAGGLSLMLFVAGNTDYCISVSSAAAFVLDACSQTCVHCCCTRPAYQLLAMSLTVCTVSCSKVKVQAPACASLTVSDDAVALQAAARGARARRSYLLKRSAATNIQVPANQPYLLPTCCSLVVPQPASPAASCGSCDSV